MDHLAGRSGEALAVLDAAIAELEDQPQAGNPLAYLFHVHTYRAFLLAHLGRWNQVLECLEPWLRMAERRGMRAVAEHLAPWLRLTALAGLRRWEDVESGLAGLEPPAPGTVFRARYHAICAQVAARASNAAGVEEHVGGALRAPVSFFQAMVLCDVALAAWAVGAHRRAAELAESARDTAKRSGAGLAQARAALIGAEVMGPGERGDALLREALGLSDDLALDELWTRRERVLAGGLLARALGTGLGPPGVAARLAATCGGDVLSEVVLQLADAPPIARMQLAAALHEAPSLEAATLRRLADDPDAEVRASARAAEARLRSRSPAPLRIVSFGSFALFRGADPLTEPTLRRGKPRALLAALLCDGASVHRERLLEWLWPDLPPDRGLASLHSTLSAVRRALDPSLDRSVGSSVIVTEGETYRLLLRTEDEWDASRFLQLACRAHGAGPLEARITRLLEAEAVRTGLFLPEWPYEEWAAQTRSEVDRAFEEVVERLAEAFSEARQPRAAISRYERLLGLDPEREAWHRALMRTYAAAGERALALRQFHLCRQLLRERLGVEPSRATQTLFASLL